MTGRLPTPPSTCSFPDCDRESIAHGLCFSHYRQKLRGKDLTPLRPLRGLKTLPLTIRVDDTTKVALEERVTTGKAKSLYEATRQAIEAGVVSWGVVYPPLEPHKRKKTNGEAVPEAEPPAIKVEEAIVHDAMVKMKDGRTFCGPIWTWRPTEGWFSIPSDSTAPEKILLSEVETASAVTRTHPGVTEDVDLLKKATTDGWTP